MEDRSHALVAVIFLIVLAVGSAGIAFWMQAGRNETKEYLIISPYGVSGLKPQAPVNFKGIEVGTVRSVQLSPKDPNKVQIRIAVIPKTPVTKAMYAQLSSNGITGISSITLQQDKDNAPPLKTSSKDPAIIPMHRSFTQKLTNSGQELVSRTDTISKRVKELLSEDNRAHISAILAHLDTATQKLVALENQVAPVLKGLPALLGTAQETMTQGQALLKQSQSLIKQARADAASLHQLLGTTNDMAQTLSGSIVPQMNSLVQSLDRTIENVNELTRSLQRNPQKVIFGGEQPPPGPGEPGYEPPSPNGVR